MFLNKLLKFKSVIFIFTFIFTFILRAHNYEKKPGPGHLDEMLYAWSGLSLVQTGIPVSWSTLDYPKRAEIYKGEINYKGGDPKASVTLYKPWLDEPPLFSFLVGVSANYFGAKQNEFVPSSYIRFPVVIISSLTSIVIFLIATLTSGYWIGVLAMLLYGVTPLFVFASRTAMPENLIAFCLSLSVYLFLLFQKTKKNIYLILLPLLVGIAGISKPTGFFILPLLIFFLTYLGKRERKFKRNMFISFLLIVTTIPFIFFFFWWGLHLDQEIFWTINRIQSFRPIGFSSLSWFFITPSFSTTVLNDSWFVFSLFSLIYFLFKGVKNNNKYVLWTTIYWIGVVMVSGGERDLLAWYRFPIYPFLVIIMAWGIKYLFQKANLTSMFIFVGLLLGNRILLVNPFHANISPINYRMMIVITLLSPVLHLLIKKYVFKLLTRLTMVLIFFFGIYYNVIYIYNAFEIECESKSCTIIPSTKLSETRLPFFWRYILYNKPPELMK